MIKWNAPDITPEVEVGEEKEFWVVAYSVRTEEEYVFLAKYQNIPYVKGEYGSQMENPLYTPNGAPRGNVGWITEAHSQAPFKYFYRIEFNKDYWMLGWAECAMPVFTGVKD